MPRAVARTAGDDRQRVLRPNPHTVIAAVASGSAAAGVLDTITEVGPSLARRDAIAWYRLLRAIDEALATDSEPPQASVTVLCLQRRRLVGASVGDCEAWWVDTDGHFDLTENQKRRPLLGSGHAEPVPFTLALPPKGRLLVATDGLFKYATPAELTDALRSPDDLETTSAALETLVTAPNGHPYDHLALILLEPDPPTRLWPW